MSRRNAGHLPVWIVCPWLALSSSAISVGAEPTDGRPAIVVDVAPVAEKRIEGARELVAIDAWDAAIDALEEVAREFGDALVEVQPGRFLNVREACHAVVAGLPPAGLARYRQRVDSAVGPAIELAIREQDAVQVARILRESFPAGDCDVAIWWLADWLWQQGNLDAARAHWTSLIPAPLGATPVPLLRYPDADYDPAAIRARLVLCSVMENDLDRARRELELLRDLHPDAEGALAGRRGAYVETIADIIDQTQTWQSRRFASAVSLSERLAGDAGYSPMPGLGVVGWETTLSTFLPHAGKSALRKVQPSCFPTVANDVILVNDARCVRALSRSDGRPAWPTDADDDDGTVYLLPEPVRMNPAVRYTGTERYSGFVADGRFFTRMGLPVVTPPAQSLRRDDGPLICLDIADGEGRLVWAIRAEQVFPSEQWVFAGPPIVLGDRLFVALQASTEQIEFGVACFDTVTAKLLWQHRVSGSLGEASRGTAQLGHRLLSAIHGNIVLSTDAGAIATLDAETGRIHWAVTYRSSVPIGASEDAAPDDLLPPVCVQDRILVAPNDSSDLFAIDAESGVVVWRRAKPGRISQLLGVASQNVIASGDQLWGINLLTGDVAWRVGYDDPAGFGFGRGILVDGAILWPTREDLFVVEPSDGTIIRRVPLRELYGQSGGNLQIANETLLVAQPDRLISVGPRGIYGK